jgi:hypothetical protein
MIRNVFDVVLLVVARVVRLKRHAIVAHSVSAVLTKTRITTAGYGPILRSPIRID